MAKKSKRRRKQPPKRYGKLVSKMKEGGLLGEGHKILYEPKGQAKMSEVILDFIKPYTEHARTDNAYESLLVLAMIAWNVAMLPESDRKAMIDRAVASLNLPSAERKELEALMVDMVERKNKHFADRRRVITGHQLTKTKNGFDLSVASSVDIDADKQ
jgi:hypothetical protein